MTKLFSLSLLCLLTFSFLNPTPASAVAWAPNFETAVAKSNQENKPIVLFFTGSDWCVWCQRLEREALETSEFINATQGKLIFVKVDFPRKTQLDPATQARNDELQRKYRVTGFPSLVIIDSTGRQIGVTGYRPGGGRAYADHLLKMTGDFGAYKNKMSQMENAPNQGFKS